MNKQGISISYILIILAFLLLLGFMVIGSRSLDKKMNERGIESDDYEPFTLNYTYKRGTLELYNNYYDYFHNYENFLIIGTDGTGDVEQQNGRVHSDMADFLLLMSIDKTENSFSLLELNRDTIMMVPVIDENKGYIGAAVKEQLCIAHWYGRTAEEGSQNQVRAVSELLGGLPIAGYYALDMEDIPKLNQSIGGVTVTLTEDIPGDPEMKKGATLTLTDNQAYLYLRSRMDVGRGTNEERMARQHTYLTEFLRQSMGKISSQPRYYYDLFESLTSIAETNLTGKQISRIAKALTENTRRGFFQFEGESRLGDTLGDGVEHSEFYPDETSVVNVMTELFYLEGGEENFGFDKEEWIEDWKNYDWREEAENYEEAA